MIVLPKIYPITDVGLSKRSHFEQVKMLIAHGASFIQIREKLLSPREFLAQARAAVAYARDRNTKIIINDRVDIAKIAGADGVHLGQDDLPPQAAREILGENSIIGFSTHSALQAELALKLPVDYIAFGPIFPTTTKKDAENVVGLEKLSEIKRLCQTTPLAAIGGIDFENFKDVLASGADSVAMISALFRGEESLKNFAAQTSY